MENRIAWSPKAPFQPLLQTTVMPCPNPTLINQHETQTELYRATIFLDGYWVASAADEAPIARLRPVGRHQLEPAAGGGDSGIPPAQQAVSGSASRQVGTEVSLRSASL